MLTSALVIRALAGAFLALSDNPKVDPDIVLRGPWTVSFRSRQRLVVESVPRYWSLELLSHRSTKHHTLILRTYDGPIDMVRSYYKASDAVARALRSL